jgi:hypothetical protein
MNNGTSEPAPAANRLPQTSRHPADDELTRTKRELLQAEVKLARARATVAGAEADIKVLNARLKALAK